MCCACFRVCYVYVDIYRLFVDFFRIMESLSYEYVWPFFVVFKIALDQYFAPCILAKYREKGFSQRKHVFYGTSKGLPCKSSIWTLLGTKIVLNSTSSLRHPIVVCQGGCPSILNQIGYLVG